MDRRTFLSSLIALGVSSKGGLVRAGEAGIVVIAHPDVKQDSVSAGELEAIFTTRKRRWDEGGRIVPFNFAPKTEARQTFDKAVLHMTPDQVARYWIDRRVRGGNRPPRQVPNPRLMVKVVSKLDGAIGYVPATTPHSGVRVVARVVDGEVVTEEGERS